MDDHEPELEAQFAKDGSKTNQIKPLFKTRMLTVVLEMPTPQSTPISAHFIPQPIDQSLLSSENSRRPLKGQRPVSAPPSSPEFTKAIITVPVSQVPQKLKRRDTSNSHKNQGLTVPPPPLFRPTTFWRRNRKSGVTGPSYSPSFHLIRRSTFIAAGLDLTKPIADLSAFCVEKRVIQLGVVVLPTTEIDHGRVVLSQDVASRTPPTLVFGPPLTAIPVASTTSINWWPYPPIGGGESSTSIDAATRDLAVSTSIPISSDSTIISASNTALSTTTSTASYIDITALPPDASSAPRPYARLKQTINPEYLIPVFVLAGFIAGSLCSCIYVRCRSRLQRSKYSDAFESGPAYSAAEKYGDEDSPSKHSMHGSPYPANRGLIPRKSSRRTPPSSTMTGSSQPYGWPSITPKDCDENDPFLVAPSIAAPSLARTRTDMFSPDPMTLLRFDERHNVGDDEVVISPYDSPDNDRTTQTRILDKLGLGNGRRKAGEVRSRNAHTRADSDCVPVEKERWSRTLGKKEPVDTFTASPSRIASTRKASAEPSSAGIRRVDSTILPTSPTMLSSARLDSQLFFSPMKKTPEKKRKSRKSLRGKTLPPAPPSADPSMAPSSAINTPVIRPSSSLYTGSSPPKRNAAERYMARHSALGKVEEIISRSRVDKQIPHPTSPTLFGAAPDVGDRKLEDVDGTGIEQRLFG